MLWQLRSAEELIVLYVETFAKQHFTLTLYHTIPSFEKKVVGKGENAGNQHFLLFPQCFLSDRRQK